MAVAAFFAACSIVGAGFSVWYLFKDDLFPINEGATAVIDVVTDAHSAAESSFTCDLPTFAVLGEGSSYDNYSYLTDLMFYGQGVNQNIDSNEYEVLWSQEFNITFTLHYAQTLGWELDKIAFGFKIEISGPLANYVEATEYYNTLSAYENGYKKLEVFAAAADGNPKSEDEAEGFTQYEWSWTVQQVKFNNCFKYKEGAVPQSEEEYKVIKTAVESSYSSVKVTLWQGFEE